MCVISVFNESAAGSHQFLFVAPEGDGVPGGWANPEISLAAIKV